MLSLTYESLKIKYKLSYKKLIFCHLQVKYKQIRRKRHYNFI